MKPLIFLSFIFFVIPIDAFPILLNQDSLQADSSGKKESSFESFLSGSFTNTKTGTENSHAALYFSGQLQLQNSKAGKKTTSIREIRSELGYINIIDSVWVKAKDNFLFSYIVRFQSKHKLQNSFSVLFKTQLTNSWESAADEKGRKWLAGPMIPATFLAGWGATISLGNTSYINVSALTVKFGLEKFQMENTTGRKAMIRSHSLMLHADLGYSVQSNLKIALKKDITLENKTNYFGKYFNKKDSKLDTQFILSFTPIKLLKIQIENRLLYDTTFSDSIQFQTEALIGLSIRL